MALSFKNKHHVHTAIPTTPRRQLWLVARCPGLDRGCVLRPNRGAETGSESESRSVEEELGACFSVLRSELLLLLQTASKHHGFTLLNALYLMRFAHETVADILR